MAVNDPAAPPAPVAPPAPPAAPPAPVAPPVAPGPDNPSWLDTLPPEAKKAIQDLRQENAGWRTKNKELEPFAKIGREMQKIAGVNGEPADPATLLEANKRQLEDAAQQIRTLKVENRLTDQFSKAGVKPALTRDLLSARGLLKDLDPDAPDFEKSVAGVIKKLSDEVPEIKAIAAPAPRGGSPHLGPGPGAPPSTQITREQVKGMKSEDVLKAFNAGQLDEVLGRKK